MSYKYQVGQTYKSRNTEEIDKLRQKYLDRGELGEFEFAYDPAKDEAYQNYANMMREQGNLAMEDAMGMATASTGGYGNSYAQSVGQQTYNNFAKEISAAQTDFADRAYNRAVDQYNRALDQLNNDNNRILNDISILEDREAADRAAWEEDYLNAYNEAVASGNKQKVADILGMSLEDYEDSLMNSGTQLGDEQIQGYINALMNGDDVNGSYYDMLQSKGYNVSNILGETAAYSLANNLGLELSDKGAFFGYTDADVTEGIRGLPTNFTAGEPFHVQMHAKEHGSADNLDVKIGQKMSNDDSNKDIYKYASSVGNGLFAFNDKLYYVNGSTVYSVDAAKNKNDEYNTLLRLVKTGKGRKGE